MATPVYTIDELSCVREKSGTRFELHVPEFRVQKGEMVVIHGSSGCGKSTLLDILGLLLPPTLASRFDFHTALGPAVPVATAAESVRAKVRRSEIGYVLQHGALVPYLTVLGNVELPMRMNGCRDSAAARKLLGRLRIEGQASKLPQFLSGGQRQRVAIARALAVEPPVVLADEPTAAVDELTAYDIVHQLRQLSLDLGTTLVFVTHNLVLARELPARWFTFHIVQPAAGRIVSTCHETAPPTRP